MANNEDNSTQEFLGKWTGEQRPQILREGMNVEDMNRFLSNLNGVAVTPQFQFNELHMQDLDAIFLRECIQQSKYQSQNGAYYHSSMSLIQFLECASEVTGELLSMDFMRQALGKHTNFLIEQYLTANKRPSVRLYKGKPFTIQAENNFYSFTKDNFGWRDASPAEIIIMGNWNGAGEAFPRNGNDEREFARYHASRGGDQSQNGASAQNSRPQANQQTNMPITEAKARAPTPPQTQWNSTPPQQQRQAPWRNQNRRYQESRLQ